MNIKNVLGDVYRIRDANGTEVAYYEYDAWGNITTKTGTMADINPFRYRGYYYDTETGFYYLQTRYYDSETRMFVNADNYEILDTLVSTLGQLNLYTYCNNNPIMYTDESGEGILLSLILIGAIVGATVAGAIAHNNGVSGWELVGAIAGGALIGGALGALAYVAAPTIGAAYGYSAAMSLQATLQYAAAGAMAIEAGVVFSQWTPGSWPGDDPTVPPGEGFEWRGKNPIGGDKGAWYNSSTGDSLHPDLNHPFGIDPHWDWINKLLKIAVRIFK